MNIMKKGTKLVVIKDFSTSALTSWGKPCTGSEECVIPKGTVMVVQRDQLPSNEGFSVIPERYHDCPVTGF